MPWIIGLDEAGYGPNLGPLVQAAVVVRAPDEVGCLWQCLAGGVRRACDPDDARLLRDALASLDDGEPVTFVIDKQGGRNYYAPLIQTALPDGWVTPLRESADVSEYTILGLGREVLLVFRPRADSGSLPVALASML